MIEISKRNRQKKSTSEAQTTADNVSQILTGAYGLKAAGMYVSPVTALGCSAVFACIGLLAESIAQLPVKVYRVVDGERREDKTHWVLKKPEQYHVFLIGDINELLDDRGIYSVLENCSVVFGENGQRIAIFETPRNDTWHGYPIFSWEKPISDDIVIKMKDKGLISEVTKQRIIDHRI